TWVVVLVAVCAAALWMFSGNPVRAIKAFTSVLIVACPCALALATPFTLGTAQRLLARINAFFKNALVIERLAHAITIVFDKTGTLTTAENIAGPFLSSSGEDPLTKKERNAVFALASQSTHPHSVRIRTLLASGSNATENQSPSKQCEEFAEIPGKGLQARVD